MEFMEFGEHMVGAGSGFNNRNALTSGPIGAIYNEYKNGGNNPNYLSAVWEGVMDVPQSLGIGGRTYEQRERPTVIQGIVQKEIAATEYTIIEHGGSSESKETSLYVSPEGTVIGVSSRDYEGGTNTTEPNPDNLAIVKDADVIFLHTNAESLGQRVSSFIEEYEAATGEPINVNTFTYKGEAIDLPARASQQPDTIAVLQSENLKETYKAPPQNDWNPFN